MTPAAFIEWLDSPTRPPLVMGILNVTPDSFSDGGQYLDPQNAIDHARKMIDAGADLIDIGGESTRPGSQRVSAKEQIRRIIPVIRSIAGMAITISVDTTRASVAKTALDVGATIINDISAATEDPDMAPLLAERQCPVVLMHMQNEPGTMQLNPTYNDVVREVKDYLLDRAQNLQLIGVKPSQIILDPGFGFGKTVHHNLLLLRHIDQFVRTGHPVLIGTSRKSFIKKTLSLSPDQDATFGTAATIAWSLTNGAGIVRVHDVEPMKLVVRMMQAISQAVAP